jgi:hypothetical protein
LLGYFLVHLGLLCKAGLFPLAIVLSVLRFRDSDYHNNTNLLFFFYLFILVFLFYFVFLKVAKQGAFYHGLATQLSQPSPVMQRGKLSILSIPYWVIIIYHKNRKYSQDRNVHQKQK